MLLVIGYKFPQKIRIQQWAVGDFGLSRQWPNFASALAQPSCQDWVDCAGLVPVGWLQLVGRSGPEAPAGVHGRAQA